MQATGSKVERVVITRLENHTYYSRIVLLLPGGIKRSVDSRPSDSLALALQCEAPLFVARQIARCALRHCEVEYVNFKKP